MIGHTRVHPDSPGNDAEILPPYEGDKPRYADQRAAVDAIAAERKAERIRKAKQRPYDPGECQHWARMSLLKNAEQDLYRRVPQEPKAPRTDENAQLAKQYAVAARANEAARERYAAICAAAARDGGESLGDSELARIGLSASEIRALLRIHEVLSQ